MDKKSKKFARWSFTNFQDDFDYSEVIANCDYLIVGREVCPKTEKIHHQCYIEFSSARYFGGVKKLLKGCHLEASLGGADANKEYCSKDKNVIIEHGTPKQQGKRNDLDEVKKKIENGLKVDEIVMDNPWIFHQYGRTLSKIEDLCMRKRFRTEMTEGIWYYGETGVGKSHKAFEGYSPDTHYVVNLNDKGWWDGYAQQDIVIINEFRGQITYADMLCLLDKWPYAVPRRGREPLPFISKKVIVTSSMKPADVYHNIDTRDSIAQLLRRLKVEFLPVLDKKYSEGVILDPSD